jgi:hypothetical protein
MWLTRTLVLPPRHQPAALIGRYLVFLASLAQQRAVWHLSGMEWRTGGPAKRPGIIEPCIPTLAARPPVGPQWIHEIKHDGYRLIARKRGGRVSLFTRRGFDWTDRYPRISAAVAALGAASATIDGEAVCCDDAGVAVFERLHSRAHDGEAFLYAFDLLEARRRGLAAPIARCTQGPARGVTGKCAARGSVQSAHRGRRRDYFRPCLQARFGCWPEPATRDFKTG